MLARHNLGDLGTPKTRVAWRELSGEEGNWRDLNSVRNVALMDLNIIDVPPVAEISEVALD